MIRGTLTYAIAGAAFVALVYQITYLGIVGTPSRAFLVVRFMLRPLRFVLLWHPSKPRSGSRIAGLIEEGHRHRKATIRLLARCDVEDLQMAVQLWNRGIVDDVIAREVFWLLKDHNTRWRVVDKVIHRMVGSAELLIELIEIELRVPSPGRSGTGLPHAISASAVVSMGVLRPLPAGLALYVAAYATPGTAGRDPFAEQWPDETRNDLLEAFAALRPMLPKSATLAEMIDLLSACVPTDQPGWSTVALPYIRQVSLAAVCEPDLAHGDELHAATAALRHRADCITDAAQLQRAGAPGDFDTLIDVIDALRSASGLRPAFSPTDEV